MMRWQATALAVIAVACGPATRPAPTPAAAPAPIAISIVGTSDLHGRIEALPVLAGYLDNLRAARGGRVVVVDAGDMFQGTLASNLAEGAPVVDAYAALGYAAAAVGNHEFDFGPVGEAATPEAPGDDARGALKARAAQAPFPLLMANVVDAETGERPAWPNVVPSTTVELDGVEVGIIGVTTEATPYTTMPINFEGLAMVPLAQAIEAEAKRLRARGIDVVVVAAHAGGRCESFDDPADLSSCDDDAEIFRVARALPAGLVDAIVAGHSHQAVAHRVNGIPIVQAYSYGKAFARVDLTISDGAVTEARIHPPVELCEQLDGCTYEGAPVAPSEAIARAIAPALERAADARAAPLGVALPRPVTRDYAAESALGNLFADLMRAARPDADVAITNGGGLRADLPAGDLTYGQLYEAMPFDNRFATVTLRAHHLAELIAHNLQGTHGIVSIAGVTAAARCDGDALRVTLTRDGEPLAPDTALVVVTSDFLASGGDGMFGRLGLPDGAIQLDGGPTIRDAMAGVLRDRGGTVEGDAAFDPSARRLTYPGERPVNCPSQATPSAPPPLVP